MRRTVSRSVKPPCPHFKADNYKIFPIYSSRFALLDFVAYHSQHWGWGAGGSYESQTIAGHTSAQISFSEMFPIYFSHRRFLWGVLVYVKKRSVNHNMQHETHMFFWTTLVFPGLPGLSCHVLCFRAPSYWKHAFPLENSTYLVIFPRKAHSSS